MVRAGTSPPGPVEPAGLCMADLPIFAGLGPEERMTIHLLASKRAYRRGEVVFHAGDPADRVYLIKSGKVRLYRVSDDGRELTLGYLKPDDIFGEHTLFEGIDQAMTAEVIEDAFVCSCDRAGFQRLITDNPEVSLKVIRGLAERVNSITERLAELAFASVKDRVMQALTRLATEYGRPTAGGTEVELDLTHQDLACLVNASRTMVTLCLKELREEGRVRQERRFVVTDRSA